MVGETYGFGSRTSTRTNWSSSRAVDPQPFHLDAAAASTPYRGLITSGWHSCAMMMRMLVDHYVSAVASLGSPGVDELRWLQPVQPGDTCGRVGSSRRGFRHEKPDRAGALGGGRAGPARGVMSMKTLGFFLRRQSGARLRQI